MTIARKETASFSTSHMGLVIQGIVEFFLSTRVAGMPCNNTIECPANRLTAPLTCHCFSRIVPY
jgi:hypothetical protein